MALLPGTRLGVYEVADSLGAGGMGEVYRARDTKLGRDVALKILPDSLAGDPDRLQRFEREARTLAALNHPHIAQIYGLENRALVMELVEGEDLAARIAAGAIPTDEALGIARQVAEALEAAHDVGIIHRDLKPANIRVRSDGTVKVLDFGLAKASGSAEGPGVSPVSMPSITTPAMTMQGVILGTAAYMSPEQAKGKAVDKRADIWAFGCVLYEMLTGQRAFDGEDVTDTLAAIVRGEPDWSKLPPLSPPVLAVLKRCLERDWRRRMASMSTVRFVLDEPAVLVPPSAATAPAVAAAPRALMIVMVAMLATVASLLAVTGARLRRSETASPVTRFRMTLPKGQVLGVARQMLALSPNGRELAYVTEGQLYVHRLSEFDPQPITVPDMGRTITSPTYSPDGAWLAFYSGSDRLVKRINLQGGAALRVCEATTAPLTIAWDEAGLLLGMGEDGIQRCSVTAGQTTRVLAAAESETMLGPQLLPGGDALLFTVAKRSETPDVRWDRADVVVQSLGSGTRRTILSSAADARLTKSGHLVYRVGGVLFGVPFDANRMEVRGEPAALVEGVMRGASGVTQLSLSDSGSLVYMPGPVATNINERELVIGDRGGAVTRVPLAAGPFVHVRAAPDGNRVALGSEDGKTAIVWTYAMDGKTALQRLTLEGNNRFPIWSADGQWIAFQSDRGGKPGIYRQLANGTGAVEQLTSAGDGETHLPESWSPDGRHLTFAVRKTTPGDALFSLWVLSLPDRRTAAFGGVTSIQPIGSTFSPDGRWIAYTRSPTSETAGADRGIYVQPFPATGAVFQAPRQLVDFHPMWTRDGSELVFLASTTARQMAAVRVSGKDSLIFGTPTRFPATVTGEMLSAVPRMFDMLPDGRLIGVVSRSEADARIAYADLRVVVNWTEELKQRLPTR